MRIAEAAAYSYELPLAEPLAGVPGLARRVGWLVHLRTVEGREGWGDAAPLPGFSREGEGDVSADLAEHLARLPGMALPDDDPIQHVSAALSRACSSVRFAVEAALWEIAASEDPAGYPGGKPVPVISLSALLSGSDARVLDRARGLVASGFRSAKLKVGAAEPVTDAERVRRVCAALGPQIPLRVDANRAWSLADAEAFAHAVRGLPLAYIEEPLRNPADLARFHEATGLSLALDETIHEGDAEPWLALPGLAAVVLKPTLAGGVQRARVLARNAEGRGIVSVVSSSCESGVGLRALAWLAAGLSSEPAGLDTYRCLAADVLEPRLAFAGPSVVLRDLSASRVELSRLRKVA